MKTASLFVTCVIVSLFCQQEAEARRKGVEATDNPLLVKKTPEANYAQKAQQDIQSKKSSSLSKKLRQMMHKLQEILDEVESGS
ncbi:MAG: hypothetical protein HOI80_05885 [Alphaproteobacteria bacterium]|jgi:hypothetical protein|nr:hypothetical protein [Alphaproteobacteria bacterium]MBT5389953.1 hypothetical protein [Alphaproteobacteria bacterium]MBT5540031.1 hypothetical protein [Alphaproteobacteria bacterium]MBT5655006.1 hypothetical protein [Alphaproteobacteria bacterium]